MATLSTADLALIRDELGDDPATSVLRSWFTELGHWLPVTIRALKRHRTAAVTGGVSQVSIPGAIGVTLAKTDISALDSQIARLEAAWAADQGLPTADSASFSRLTRVTAR